MKVLSLNCRGLASTWKKLSIKRLISVQKSDVVLFQETLGPESTVTGPLKNTIKNFEFIARDARGHSGGQVIGWNPNVVNCIYTWRLYLGLGL